MYTGTNNLLLILDNYVIELELQLVYFCSWSLHFTLSGILSCQTTNLKITATVTDPKCVIKINGNEGTKDVALNLGRTKIVIQVTSADGSNTQVTLF